MPQRRLSKKRHYGSKKHKNNKNIKKRKSRDKNNNVVPSFLSYLLLVSMLSSGNYLLKESGSKSVPVPEIKLEPGPEQELVPILVSRKPLGLSDKFKIKIIEGDGSCMFRSIQHQLNIKKGINSDEGYQKLRPLIQEYMKNEMIKNPSKKEIYRSVMKALGYNGIIDYFGKMAKENSTEWGDHLALEAISSELGKRIVIVQTTDGAIITIGGEKVKNMDEITDEDIVLSYYPENHYNSLVKKY